MGSLTVRKLDDEVMRDLRISAAIRGVSMEQEARDRLRRPLPAETSERQRNSSDQKWHLESPLEDILALGRRPEQQVDHKAESDALYAYLDKL